MADRILVINPNSSEVVTAGIDAAMAPLRIPGGPEIECMLITQGPKGIENEGHVAQVVPLISETIKARDNDCSAFVALPASATRICSRSRSKFLATASASTRFLLRALMAVIKCPGRVV